MNTRKDWDSYIPYVVVAYRSSKYEATQFSPNYLMLGREVRAPVDVVYVVPVTAPPISYDSYVDELSDRMQAAYTLVREHLNVAAERKKWYYDLRVKPHKYAVGDWYFNPRKLVVAKTNGGESLEVLTLSLR